MSISDDLRAAKGLTKAQRHALELLAEVDSLSAQYLRTMYHITARTMDALMDKGFVVPTNHSNGVVWHLTDAGHRAIAAAETTK